MSNLFGKTYNDVGNTSADLLLKTKGLVKILFGNNFIDLVKDGNINVQSKFIYSEDSIGSKDGIYVVGDNATLVINEQQIPLNLKGTTYVSFLDKLELKRELQEQALVNIGFLYKSLDDIKDVSNGIVYVQDLNKLYIINSGKISEFSASIPDTITDQLIFRKDNSKIGCILILGENKENGIAFNSMNIYSGTIDIEDSLKIIKNNRSLIELDDKSFKCNTKVIVDDIQSSDESFRIFKDISGSTLNVNTLVADKILGASINLMLPINSIILYDGTTAPDGWAICNGENDTPNLPSLQNEINYIIKIS